MSSDSSTGGKSRNVFASTGGKSRILASIGGSSGSVMSCGGAGESGIPGASWEAGTGDEGRDGFMVTRGAT